MKKSDKIKYQKMTVDQLTKEMTAVKGELVQLRIKQSLGQANDTSLFKKNRYKIAYFTTLISQKLNDSTN